MELAPSGAAWSFLSRIIGCCASTTIGRHLQAGASSPKLIIQGKGWALRVGDIRLELGIVADCIVVCSK